jgi:alpha-beta hydrolase superfamily lysophospholipase
VLSVSEVHEYLRMSDGFSLFSRSWKPVGETNKTIVCIHGIGSHSGAFKPIGEALANEGIEVYGLDLRGFGNSIEDGLPRGDTRSFSRHMQDLDEAVDIVRKRAKTVKVYMLGHSLGCCHALWYAANYPDALDGLILVAPAVEVRPRIAKKDMIRFSFLLLRAPETMIDTQALLARSEERIDQGIELFDNSLQTTRFSVRWLSGIGRNLMRDKIFENASKTKKPTIIVQGEADQDAFPSGAQRLYDGLAATKKVIKMFPEADHSLYNSILRIRPSKTNLEKREQVVKTIKNWLDSN